MCVVSNIGDSFTDDWRKRYPIQPIYPINQPYTTATIFTAPEVSKEEFDKLKKEVEALRELLVAARKYDEATNQKDCEMESKIAFMKQVGEWLGVDLESVFKNKQNEEK